VKVEYRRSGGFGGLLAGCDLDTARMDPREAEKLTALVRDCEGARSSVSPPSARDTLVHEIRLEEDDGTSRTLRFDEMNLPASAGLLLDFLGRRSAPREP